MNFWPAILYLDSQMKSDRKSAQNIENTWLTNLKLWSVIKNRVSQNKACVKLSIRHLIYSNAYEEETG